MRRAVLLLALAGCGAADTEAMARATAYDAELVACNRTAETLKQSIDCENEVRARYGRPFRASPRLFDAGAR